MYSGATPLSQDGSHFAGSLAVDRSSTQTHGSALPEEILCRMAASDYLQPQGFHLPDPYLSNETTGSSPAIGRQAPHTWMRPSKANVVVVDSHAAPSPIDQGRLLPSLFFFRFPPTQTPSRNRQVGSTVLTSMTHSAFVLRPYSLDTSSEQRSLQMRDNFGFEERTPCAPYQAIAKVCCGSS